VGNGKYYSVNVPLKDGIDDEGELWGGIACINNRINTRTATPMKPRAYGQCIQMGSVKAWPRPNITTHPSCGPHVPLRP